MRSTLHPIQGKHMKARDHEFPSFSWGARNFLFSLIAYLYIPVFHGNIGHAGLRARQQGLQNGRGN